MSYSPGTPNCAIQKCQSATPGKNGATHRRSLAIPTACFILVWYVKLDEWEVFKSLNPNIDNSALPFESLRGHRDFRDNRGSHDPTLGITELHIYFLRAPPCIQPGPSLSKDFLWTLPTANLFAIKNFLNCFSWQSALARIEQLSVERLKRTASWTLPIWSNVRDSATWYRAELSTQLNLLAMFA